MRIDTAGMLLMSIAYDNGTRLNYFSRVSVKAR